METRSTRGVKSLEHFDGGIAQSVILEMAVDKYELRTEFARLPSWHPAADSGGPGNGSRRWAHTRTGSSGNNTSVTLIRASRRCRAHELGRA
jgi:hypothetical protein